MKKAKPMNLEDELQHTTPILLNAVTECKRCAHADPMVEGISLSGQEAVHHVLKQLIALLFPGCHVQHDVHHALRDDVFTKHFKETAQTLRVLCAEALRYQGKQDACIDGDDRCETEASAAVADLMRALPDILNMLQKDILAAYEGDPAARSTMEVVMSYPGVFATIVHRIAHHLYRASIPLIPRVMSEYAHSRTGIDIHPGATIGEGFFIDHGTGVVIGETCVIGRRVKLYQGVTLGALSFAKDEQGRLVKGIKRHPDVGDGVVIYAGATILGGETRIGEHSVIGGNVWLTHSVPPHAKVYNHQPNPLIREKDGSWKTVDGPWNDPGAGI